MTNWSELETLKREKEDIVTLWLVAIPVLEDVTHLRIQAAGRWSGIFGLSEECGPDGFSRLPIDSAHLPVPQAPAGALIAKFGGSSAVYGKEEDDSAETAAGKPFIVGTHRIVQVPQDSFGPLFIGFNADYRPVHILELNVTLATAVVHP